MAFLFFFWTWIYFAVADDDYFEPRNGEGIFQKRANFRKFRCQPKTAPVQPYKRKSLKGLTQFEGIVNEDELYELQSL